MPREIRVVATPSSTERLRKLAVAIGSFVACAGAAPPGRAEAAVVAVDLELVRRVDVEPREGKRVLFHVVVARAPGRKRIVGGVEVARFVVRSHDGALADDMIRAREAMGLPPALRRGAPTDGALRASSRTGEPDRRRRSSGAP